MARKPTYNRRIMLVCAGLTALMSQISVSVQAGGFHLSVAIILLQILLFTLPGLPTLPLTALSAAGVCLLRTAGAALSGRPFGEAALEAVPEIAFYLCFAVLFRLFFEGKRTAYRLSYTLPLAAMDAAGNLVELLLRGGREGLSLPLFLQIAAAGLVRAGAAGTVLLALRRYGVQILRREDAARYRKLLFMTADLRSELVWMEKGSALAEDTMNRAYRLYRSLCGDEGSSPLAGEALLIAKDVHEIKKEYALVMRGISAALDRDTARDGMALTELFRLLAQSAERFASGQHKAVCVQCRCETELRTARHYELMSVLRNLLNNSVEAAPEGRDASVALCAQRDSNALTLTVEDDCGGIPAGRLSEIFTPGFSSKINPQTGEISRGLGLSIVKDLVEKTLKGSITVRSSDGITVFTVRIPIENL